MSLVKKKWDGRTYCISGFLQGGFYCNETNKCTAASIDEPTPTLGRKRLSRLLQSSALVEDDAHTASGQSSLCVRLAAEDLYYRLQRSKCEDHFSFDHIPAHPNKRIYRNVKKGMSSLAGKDTLMRIYHAQASCS